MATRLVQVKCPKCRTLEVFPASKVGKQVECWNTEAPRFKLPNGKPFGVCDWDESRSPRQLRQCLQFLRITPSPRANAHFATALVRALYPRSRSVWLWKAVEHAEHFVATGNAPLGEMAKILEGLRQGQPMWLRPPWALLGLCCITSDPLGWPWSAGFDAAKPVIVANLIRDLIPNPFVPLEWNPEWFTSTVQQLAAHIYQQRDFSAMPILGDALMDAGCDHQLIQEHCRSTKPHARGCWVVDAILGKT